MPAHVHLKARPREESTVTWVHIPSGRRSEITQIIRNVDRSGNPALAQQLLETLGVDFGPKPKKRKAKRKAKAKRTVTKAPVGFYDLLMSDED